MKIKYWSKLKTWALGSAPEVETAPALHRPPDMLPGVIPAQDKLAMDDAMSDAYAYANQSQGCYQAFPGYPTLAQLTQQAENRMLSEKTSLAMTRKWVKLRSSGDEDKTILIAALETEMKRFRLRELFGEAAKQDGWFGRCQLFVDMGEQSGKSLEIPLIMDAAVMLGKLRKFKIVEAMYTYPNDYSASNPMADDYYAPRSWFVMGQKVHSSRLLTFIARPVPDMLKPSYNFGGISMTQLAKPYVDNWLQTRTSVGKLLRNFSTSGIKTNMADVLSGGEGEGVLERAQLYTQLKDNQDLMVLDMETEDFFQYNVPLSTVDKLQAQAQEHMASVASMPLSILLGITPTGLNASTDGEIRTFYDHVKDMQEVLFRDNLDRALAIIQLSKFGEVDPDITYDFVSLWEQSEDELAANRKSDAEAGAIYVEMGAVSPEEVRRKLAADPNSGYNGIDVDVMPEPPEDDDETTLTK